LVVVLADEPPFALGDLTVRPALRQVVCADNSEHILEPRVMQVLVALARAQGGIVSRDKLIEQCWEGRIVGEDAINRVIGRLRQFAQSDAANAFRIETVPRVGYRLLLRDQAEPQIPAAPMADPAALLPLEPPPLVAPNRRALLVGAGTAAAVAAGGAAWWFTRPAPSPVRPTLSPEIADLLTRARSAAERANPEGAAEALGLYYRVVELAPDNADGWGGIALTSAFKAHGSNPSQVQANRLQSEAALRKTIALDPHNAFVYATRTALTPIRGAWLEGEQILREGLRYHPQSVDLLRLLADIYGNVGRLRESALLMDRVVAIGGELSPGVVWFHIQTLWADGRLQEADAAAERGIATLPRNAYVWFSRFYLYLFTGRADQALTIINDLDNRPTGIPDADFVPLTLVATALKTNDKTDVDKAVAAVLEQAHHGGGYAENATKFLCALGHLDDAFTVTNGMFFNRGFAVGDLRFSATQGGYTVLQDRRTRQLFLPPARPMRRDPRFAPLMDELRLTDYWRKAGVRPDYQTGSDG